MTGSARRRPGAVQVACIGSRARLRSLLPAPAAAQLTLAALLFSLATLLLICVVSPPAGAATGGWVCGTVTDASGEPVTAVFVQFELVGTEDQFSTVTMTGDDGSWSTSRIEPGQYVVRFTDPLDRYGFQYYGGSSLFAQARPVTVADRTVLYDIDATLADGGSISGVVRDADGHRLKDTSIDLFYPAGDGTWMLAQEVEGEADGSYKAAGLAAGPYRLRFSGGHPRGGRVFYKDSVTFGKARQVQVEQGAAVNGISGRLTSPGSITGQVRGVSGRLLSGINVAVIEAGMTGDQAYAGAYVRSTATGRYRVNGLGSTGYVLFAYDPNGTWAPQLYRGLPITTGEADEVSVRAGKTTGHVDFRMQRAGSVSGRVLDSSGHPIRTLVTAYFLDPASGTWWEWPNAYAVSGPKGGYLLNGLPAGICRISFYAVTRSGFLQMYYANATTPETGTDVTVAAGKTTTGIDQTIPGTAAPESQFGSPTSGGAEAWLRSARPSLRSAQSSLRSAQPSIRHRLPSLRSAPSLLRSAPSSLRLLRPQLDAPWLRHYTDSSPGV